MPRIYVDLDDVLSQTAHAFLRLLAESYDKVVDFDRIESFDLGVSLGLGADELRRFMHDAHRPELLLGIEPVAGAAGALESWRRRGYEVHVMTGRPPATAEVSRAWLERHAMPHDALHFVDKYARYDPAAWEGPEPVLRLDDIAADGYRLFVEDSLTTAGFLARFSSAPVALMDRPWNRDLSRVDERAAAAFHRCTSWEEIAGRFPEP